VDAVLASKPEIGFPGYVTGWSFGAGCGSRGFRERGDAIFAAGDTCRPSDAQLDSTDASSCPRSIRLLDEVRERARPEGHAFSGTRHSHGSTTALYCRPVLASLRARATPWLSGSPSTAFVPHLDVKETPMSDLNDPRVLFAAERTLLAWNRTSISLMAFGFVIERFGLFLQIAGRQEVTVFERHISFFVGVTFILLASFLAAYSILQHIRILRTLKPAEIPSGYSLRMGIVTNAVVGLLGVVLSIYLSTGFF
jgi:putative membrane protein